MKAFCFYQERKWIKIKVTFQAMSKQAEPAVLRQISKHLALLGALEFEPKHMLKMMNHLVDKHRQLGRRAAGPALGQIDGSDRKSTRLNSSHVEISYAVFCLKKKKKTSQHHRPYQNKKRDRR